MDGMSLLLNYYSCFFNLNMFKNDIYQDILDMEKAFDSSGNSFE